MSSEETRLQKCRARRYEMQIAKLQLELEDIEGDLDDTVGPRARTRVGGGGGVCVSCGRLHALVRRCVVGRETDARFLDPPAPRHPPSS